MNLIFYDKKVEKKFYTIFPLSKLIKIQEDEEDEYEKVQILFPYVKTPRYGNKMIEPLKQVIQNDYNPYIHVNNSRDKQSLTIYKYCDDSQHELELIDTTQVSKNPLYGLVHYMNLDLYSFQSKYLVLQELTTVTIDKELFKKVKDFFNMIETKNYTFMLNINEQKEVNLSFNLNDCKDSYKSILSFKDFDIEFIFNIFASFFSFVNLLDYLHKNGFEMRFCYERSSISLYIGDVFIEFERNSELVYSFLRDFIRDNDEKTMLQQILSFFKTTNRREEMITAEEYFNYYRQKNIINEIRERL